MYKIKNELLSNNFSLIGSTVSAERVQIDLVNAVFNGKKTIVVGEEWQKNVSSSTFFVFDGKYDTFINLCKKYKDVYIILMYPLTMIEFDKDKDIDPTFSKVLHIKEFLQKIRKISYENNIKFVLFSQTYNNMNSFQGSSHTMYVPDYVISMYKFGNEYMIDELKNRNSQIRTNINMSSVLTQLYRQRKLERILKI